VKRSVTFFMAAAVLILTGARPAGAAAAQKPIVEVLWPRGAPGARPDATAETHDRGHVRNVHTPAISVYLPPRDRATGACVVICPGGGYGVLAMEHEGTEIAAWLNRIGVAGVILKYRHRPYRHPVPLMDAQRALRTVRYRAKEWGIDPGRIGIMGFSAGGHLASTAGTHFGPGDPSAEDPIDRVSDRPDIMILVYPVVSFTEDFTHRGSRRNLLGDNPDPKLVENLSNERQVTEQTPPTFLVHATDDRAVPPENSIHFYLALRAAKVPAEMHIYEKGGHGFGMRADRCVAAGDWPRRCADWLEGRGFLKRTK
jgi:acetyl esterase/lipase